MFIESEFDIVLLALKFYERSMAKATKILHKFYGKSFILFRFVVNMEGLL
jgi:hypothetical protein